MTLARLFTVSFAVVSSLALTQPAWCIDVDVAEAPTNDLALTVSAIQSAQQTLQLNVYELSSPDIAQALVNRIQAGVQVQILLEGQPVGGMSTASKGIVSELVQAMQGASNSADFVYEMTSKAGGNSASVKRRYRYDHAKYIVVDGNTVLMGSENYSPTGNPEPGSLGNRGWEALIHDSTLAQSFAQMFASDSDPSNSDIMNMSSQSVAYAFGLVGHKPKPHPNPKPQPIPAPFPPANFQPNAMAGPLVASAVDTFHSPDTSLAGLQSLLDNATTSIDIELMTFNEGWGKNGGQSPLLTALLNAARRGVHVRVLLNDESVFLQTANNNPQFSYENTHKPINPLTIQALQNAAAQGLPIEAQIANVKAMGVDYIHNKGMLVDGDLTLISSINWDENSVENNRETAVVITSPDVYNHFEALFNQDWQASGGSAPSAAASASPTWSSRLAHSVQATSVDCPRSIDVSVQIGDISVQSGEDSSYASLSGQSFTLTMSRDRTSTSCIFLSGNNGTRKRVFEIRGSHGEALFILDGFTSDGEVYSIRARSDEGLQSDQTLDAHVYEGSGGHASLGDAEMEVRIP